MQQPPPTPEQLQEIKMREDENNPISDDSEDSKLPEEEQDLNDEEGQQCHSFLKNVIQLTQTHFICKEHLEERISLRKERYGEEDQEIPL